MRTDSRELTWIERFKDTKAELFRWALLLQKFDYNIEHYPRKENELPDALSREPQEDEGQSHNDEDYNRLLLPSVGEFYNLDDDPLP